MSNPWAARPTSQGGSGKQVGVDRSGIPFDPVPESGRSLPGDLRRKALVPQVQDSRGAIRVPETRMLVVDPVIDDADDNACPSRSPAGWRRTPRLGDALVQFGIDECG